MEERAYVRMIFDLTVIGGGPAGSAAAITAARAGATVLLLERGRFPRHKVCGEFVSAESIGLLHQLLAPEYKSLIEEAPEIPRSRIFLDGSELSAEIVPPAVSITRFDLDNALWMSARTSGVTTRDDCPARKVGGRGPFKLTTDGGNFEARAVINATGRWSNLTSESVRARAPQERWIGIKSHFREAVPPNSVDLYFFEGGYCGVQPVSLPNGSSGIVNACAMVRADVAINMPEVLRLNPRLRERSQNWTALMDAVRTSQLIFHDPELVHDFVLQAGDAATFVDPFIGDGISLALRSGELAAECLNPFFRGQCTLEQVGTEYSKRYEQRLAPIFRASSRLRELLNWPQLVRKPVLSILQRTPAVTSMVVKMTR